MATVTTTSRRETAPRVVARAHSEVRRFTAWQVFEHAVLMVSFTGLAVTGLVQTFSTGRLAQWLMGAMGGIETVRGIHHALAAALGVLSVLHGAALLVRGRRYGWYTEMWPSLQDVKDLLDTLNAFLGLRERPPEHGRFSFKEKFEYWAVVWGTAVMGITGVIMLYPEWFTRFVPGVAVPAARAAHRGEAILAVLAIIIWHMYNAHLRADVFPGDTVIFTGRMSVERLREEHPLEYRRLVAAGRLPAVTPAARDGGQGPNDRPQTPGNHTQRRLEGEGAPSTVPRPLAQHGKTGGR